jgi:hypothetical protein
MLNNEKVLLDSADKDSTNAWMTGNKRCGRVGIGLIMMLPVSLRSRVGETCSKALTKRELSYRFTPYLEISTFLLSIW